MKKTIRTVALIGASLFMAGSAFANNDPYDFSDDKFEGWFIGGEVNSARYKFKDGNQGLDISRGVGINVAGGFGFSFGDSDLIGQIQERVGFGSASIKGYGEELKERFSSSISYLQGYRIADTLMPYAKVSFDLTYFDTNEKYIASGAGYGVGFGGGLKFAVSDNVELGVEYSRLNIKGKDDIKLKGDNIALNLGYRF